MKNLLNLKLHNFIKDKGLTAKKLLVAVSSGVDSIVLLHELLKIRDYFNLDLGVAHIHHGWRKESDEEYEFMQKLCLSQKVTFHGKKLNIALETKDLENSSRRLRYQAFTEILKTFGYYGVILGHHKQDLEETVIKRVLEGSHLAHLFGMKEVSKFDDFWLYRPFLTLDKQVLLKAALDQDWPFFEDKTNQDSRFLRTRLRTMFFPLIEPVFGKNLSKNLAHLAYQSEKLASYFEDMSSKNLEIMEIGSLGAFVVFFKKNLHTFEIENLLLVFFKQRAITLSRNMIEDMTQVVFESCHPKIFRSLSWKFMGSRDFLFMEDLRKKNLLKDELNQDSVALVLSRTPLWFRKSLGLSR
jgi:tRNA(Ile)-lysidine synthase